MPEKFFDFQQGLNALSKPTDIGDLVALRRWIPYCGDPKRLRVLASALPEAIAGLAHEQSLELAHIAMELAAYSPTIARGLASLPVRLQVQWRRAQWCAGVFSEECSEKQFLQTIAGWGGKERSHPEVLLKRALCAEDSRLRSFALENISVSVKQLRISASLGFLMVESLCRDSEPALRIRAFDAFHTPWHLHVSLQEKGKREACIERALFDGTPSVALAAARCAIRLGLSQPLRAAYLNTECALSVRVFIVTEFAPMATRSDLEEVLSLPEEEPLAFLAAIRSFVLDAHRHGLFLRSCDLETILELYDSHSAWQAEELVRVTYVERNALNSLLATLDADDERWLRRSKILSAGYGEAPSKLLSILLQTCTNSRIASSLLGAASECAAFDDVDSLLCWWKECPQEVIPALRAEVDWPGSTKAKQALWSLIEAPLTPITLRKQALEVFWCLTTDRSATLEKLATLLGPDESQLLHFLKTEDTPLKGTALLVQMPWPEASPALDPWLRFEAICHSHDSCLRASVIEQFRELFFSYVSLALQGDFSVKRLQMPLLEQQLFTYGRNLISSERCVRPWVESFTETGRDFVLLVALEWLREEPEEAIVVALLELVARHAPNGAVLRAIEPYWRHRHKGVQRAGIAAILAAGEAARGLEVSICRLGESADARILCQVYEAVENLGARWAASMVVKGLEHEKMSVKKSAAEALAVVGSPLCISALIFWLGKHDNHGFRQSLKRALVKATEDNAHLPLLEALEGEENPRTIELLWDALCGILSLPLVVRLASFDSESKCAIVQACLDGTIGLQGASRDALALSLHRAEKRTIVEKKTSPRDEICIQGFSDKAAQRFIDESEETFDNEDLQWVKSRFSDWVHWVCSQTSPSVEGTSLLLRAATQDDAVHFSDILNCAGKLKKNLTMGPFLEFVHNCHIGGGFDAKCRVQAIKILCDSPPNPSIGGLNWFEALGSLRAFRTGEQLRSALNACYGREDGRRESSELLCHAFQIPVKTAGEPSELTTLRQEAEYFSKTPESVREVWLESLLEEKPLDVPLVQGSHLYVASPVVFSESRKNELLSKLKNGAEIEQERAAEEILSWPDCNLHDELLSVFLAGELKIRSSYRLAQYMKCWPKEACLQGKANQLIRGLNRQQIHDFLPEWIEQWKKGLRTKETFGGMGQEELLDVAATELSQGNATLVALLSLDSSFALQSLVQMYSESFPAEFSHLISETTSASEGECLLDPLAGLAFEGLCEFAVQRTQTIGARVRAVHALAEHGEESRDVLEVLALDREAKVRSAALRAYRKVATKEQGYALALEIIQSEPRRDVVVQLLQSLGHAQYQPAMGILIESLLHSDLRIAAAANAAVRGWGPAAIPSLSRAAKKARPDKRKIYMTVLKELDNSL